MRKELTDCTRQGDKLEPHIKEASGNNFLS